ncbi:flavodoxin family protein [Pelagibacterium xiamenense]|uniref:flavodoxin family protein n=1 Tax=Pelagibacterium xiamenense TaxID=2901140 RepID=UPI001E33182C|nr:NAD(P)H-dependent oxidoreductase [Pelagibacterium xiamenense]MCD7059694.1 NAD(P)H-dependent oxidoreductase [Pelagibacterium xiamenense]
MPETPALRILALNCSLKPTTGAPSSTERMLDCLLSEFDTLGTVAETLRVADFDIRPGVTSDEGNGDEWPMIRQKIIEADILLLGSPIWLGHPSSVAARVLERLDAFLGEKDQEGRMPSYNKVAAAAVVGNEDGAHHVSAELFQGLNDVGFSLAPNAVAYWVGEAMQATDFVDLETVPDRISSTCRMVARSTAHLARLLKQDGYPSVL